MPSLSWTWRKIKSSSSANKNSRQLKRSSTRMWSVKKRHTLQTMHPSTASTFPRLRKSTKITISKSTALMRSEIKFRRILQDCSNSKSNQRGPNDQHQSLLLLGRKINAGQLLRSSASAMDLFLFRLAICSRNKFQRTQRLEGWPSRNFGMVTWLKTTLWMGWFKRESHKLIVRCKDLFWKGTLKLKVKWLL